MRVEATVFHVVELALALGTHREPGHGGARAVVGNIERDGEPGAALRAVGECVTVPPVGSVLHFAFAGFASREVGWNGKYFVPFDVARADAEPLRAFAFERADEHSRDTRTRAANFL